MLRATVTKLPWNVEQFCGRLLAFVIYLYIMLQRFSHTLLKQCVMHTKLILTDSMVTL